MEPFDPLEPLGRVDRLNLNFWENLDWNGVSTRVQLQSHLSAVLAFDVELQDQTAFNASRNQQILRVFEDTLVDQTCFRRDAVNMDHVLVEEVKLEVCGEDKVQHAVSWVA